MTNGAVPYEERHWLKYGVEYTVTDIGEQDTGGRLTLLIPIPPVAEQLIIRRATPKTQEIDLHNGARLPAELIETIGDKVTMLVQEVSEQIITEEDGNDLKQAWQNLQTAFEAEVEHRNQRDTEIQQDIENILAKQDETQYLTTYIIEFIESKLGPLGGIKLPLIFESGEYFVIENGDYLVVA